MTGGALAVLATVLADPAEWLRTHETPDARNVRTSGRPSADSADVRAAGRCNVRTSGRRTRDRADVQA